MGVAVPKLRGLSQLASHLVTQHNYPKSAAITVALYMGSCIHFYLLSLYGIVAANNDLTSKISFSFFFFLLSLLIFVKCEMFSTQSFSPPPLNY